MQAKPASHSTDQTSSARAAQQVSARRNRVFDDRSHQLDRFGPLLALTFVTVTLMSLVDLRNPDGGAWRTIAAQSVVILIGVTLLLALRASGVSRRWRVGAEILLAIAATLTVALLALQLATDAELSAMDTDRPSVVWVAIALLTPIAVVRRLLQHQRVITGTLMGAIAAYLLIALAFCYLMLLVGEEQPGGFFVGEADAPTTTYMYFSLVSLTTVGYGDVSPATDLGRYVASMEAVVGQVYLVTFVAMLVGLWIHGRSQER